MELPKFLLTQDWEIENNTAGIINKFTIKKGETFEPDVDKKYSIKTDYGTISLSIDNMRSANINGSNLFTEIVNKSNLIIEEVSEDDDNLVSNWRIQLDVKTTRRKLKEVQRLIDIHIKPIL